MGVVEKAKFFERRGDNKKALAIIERGIQVIKSSRTDTRDSVKILYDLLDARAHYFSKCYSWKLALRDVNEMIRLAPRDGRGYLRKVQIYNHNGQYDNSTRVCKAAIPIVSRKSPHWYALSREWGIAKSRSKAQHVDPITRLPGEIMNKILLDIFTTTKDIVSTMLVSKRWYNFIVNEPLLWSRLYFPDSRQYIPYGIIDRFCTRSKERALHLHISPNIQRPSRLLGKLKSYNNLTSLRIDKQSITLDDLAKYNISFPNLTSLTISTVEIDNSLPWALGTMSRLRELSLVQSNNNSNYIPNTKYSTVVSPLKSLSITSRTTQTESLTHTFVRHVIDQCKDTLCSLRLHYVLATIGPIYAILSSQTLVNFGFTATGRIQEAPFWNDAIKAPLKVLSLGKVKFSIPREPQPALLSLEHLSLNGCVMPTWSLDTLLRYFNCSNSLQTLNLKSSTMSVLPNSSPSDMEICSLVTCLAMTTMPPITNQKFLEHIGEIMPNLERINVNNTLLSNAGIATLLRSGIKTINCRSSQHNITRATHALATEKGVTVLSD